MKKKILLIHLPQIYSGKRRYPAWLPLGLAYTATYLMKDGYEVEVLDIDAHMYSKEKVISILKEKQFDYAGISAMAPEFKYVKWISEQIKLKESNPKVILGGALAMNNSEVVLDKTGVDICVMGEGETTFPKILNTIESSGFEELENVKGISFLKKNNYVKTLSMEYIEDIDTIEFPAWDLFPVELYLKTPFFFDPSYPNSMNMISARGCPWNCNFCSKTFKSVRMRSVDNIIKEIKLLKEKYNVGQIYFAEELLMVSEKRMLEVCEKIKPLNIKWICMGRVNVVTPKMLRKMKEAGCVWVGYGIESGSQKILDKMNKQVTVEQNAYGIKETLKAGLRPHIQMMYGYPGEDMSTIEETKKFCMDLHIEPMSGFSIATPLPGTQLYTWAKEKGLIKNEFEYLMGLEGFCGLYLNCTDFSDEDLIKNLDKTEKEINNAFRKHRLLHPHLFVKDYWLKFQILYYANKKYGIKKTIKKVLNVIKNNPKALTRAEYE
ncbi:B12-binding domain-containing radical SAM protein [Candidatus Woesearchaeota archaeon]|jgi:anaerobic magnesium-protoporphyrin IX monomethyl ester cyclase|nr:B12-binding domain-containing radical SAM protein [Candidatus Woesearchaeota archaeon]MBT5273100.1 B12-binding domain-containing radical SAM protein [Candidatus Woesearchaeota archaeon]MBT6041763.1 B12-binding domain-containing radical SAM protein [Candidatus Woesearchaeota archaeon]MBT6337585.1 B12-binding domain-containing radical SAM protein [Candidatus Woesearchaeota archaeon]MBT7927014.1 B12-binding domain-containing radical SAM protein [Candidatus Woesearchaeota archaeon]